MAFFKPLPGLYCGNCYQARMGSSKLSVRRRRRRGSTLDSFEILPVYPGTVVSDA